MKSSDNVVFCDNHILVANKPSGWLTQPDGSNTPDLETAMKEWVKEKYNKPGAVFLHAIHRIDRPVSGLVLFARTSKALTRLNEQVREGDIQRFYVAEVEGAIQNEDAVLDHYLVHGEHRAVLAQKGDPEAKRAVLRYHLEKKVGNRSWVSIELETGRYHQIRAQFAAIRHPIVGDRRYGALDGDGKSIRLHCAEIRFTHPVTKEALTYNCEAPF